MRKIFYGAAIAAGVLLVAVLVGRQPYSATASQFKANDIVDVRALEATIDMSALPRQDIPSESYQ
jgi:hypothetical protein